jgi:acyl-CoA reductase-like NAD-dependent aldehyde dehydrogenase
LTDVALPPRLDALVGGRWRAGTGDRWIDVLDPADTRQVVAQVPAMSDADVDEAYRAAAEGARQWRRTNALQRAAVLARGAALLRERAAQIAADLVREMGKTLAEATIEAAKAADFFDFYASLARLPTGYSLADARAGTNVSVRYEPVGVVLAITPWNDPLLTPARKLAPALSAGNAVILKPATDTPLVALHLARALTDGGLPANVLATVIGRGRDVGDALLAGAPLAAVTFTGSTEVGLGIHRALAGRNVRVQTEMGGKNASVVLADADLDLAADTIAAAAFGQGGQRCTATSRVIVDRRVADALIDRLVARAARLRLGSGLEAETQLGPLVSAAQRDGVLAHVVRALDEGSELRSGGSAPTGDAYAHGCYVEPTVLTAVERDMAIWTDEVFGPVIAVHEVDGLDEAIEATNDSAYGLSAAVFTDSLAAATRFMDEVETGQVAVNLPTSGWDVHHPFGGFRDSGSPFKEQGVEALRFYTRVKTCAVRTG